MSEMVEQAEKRGYAKGYNAGKRYADKRSRAELADRRREEFVRQVVLAILPQLIARPWKNGEKVWTTAGEHARGAFQIAREVAAQSTFSGDPDDATVLVAAIYAALGGE